MGQGHGYIPSCQNQRSLPGRGPIPTEPQWKRILAQERQGWENDVPDRGWEWCRSQREHPKNEPYYRVT